MCALDEKPSLLVSEPSSFSISGSCSLGDALNCVLVSG
eukprot:UN00137